MLTSPSSWGERCLPQGGEFWQVRYLHRFYLHVTIRRIRALQRLTQLECTRVGQRMPKKFTIEFVCVYSGKTLRQVRIGVGAIHSVARDG